MKIRPNQIQKIKRQNKVEIGPNQNQKIKTQQKPKIRKTKKRQHQNPTRPPEEKHTILTSKSIQNPTKSQKTTTTKVPT